MDVQGVTRGRRDSSRFLAAMLERVESQIGEFGRFYAAKNAKHPAFIVEVIVRQLLGTVHSLFLAAFRAVAAMGRPAVKLFRAPRSRNRAGSAWYRAHKERRYIRCESRRTRLSRYAEPKHYILQQFRRREQANRLSLRRPLGRRVLQT